MTTASYNLKFNHFLKDTDKKWIQNYLNKKLAEIQSNHPKSQNITFLIQCNEGGNCFVQVDKSKATGLTDSEETELLQELNNHLNSQYK